MKKKRYRQLSSEERYLIEKMKAEGRTNGEISSLLGRSRSTIGRELRRNQQDGSYESHIAHERFRIRNSTCLHRCRLKNNETREYVRQKLKYGWSPELISGRLQLEKPSTSISPEAIYQWIYVDAPEYRHCLVRKHAKRWRKRRNKKHRQIQIPSRIGIEDRPRVVNERKELGHWECDTMIFRKKGPALQVVTERLSRFTRLKKIAGNQARPSSEGVVFCLGRIPPKARKTIT